MRGTANPKAFKAYLEGQKIFSIFKKTDIDRSRKKFERATKLDPKFARAWSHLSYTYSRGAITEWGQPGDLELAEEYATKAIELDENDYVPHWDAALAYLNGGKFADAMKEYRTALDLYENWTDMLDRKHGLLAEMAEAYTYVGQPRRAIALLERAKRYPDWYRWNAGCAYYHAKDYNAALDELENMSEKPGEGRYVMDVQLFIAAAYAQKGNKTMAKAALDLFRDDRRKRGLRRYMLKDVPNRGSFKNQGDEDLLVEGLYKAGLR